MVSMAGRVLEDVGELAASAVVDRPSWANDDIALAWWNFHRANPDVYARLVELARAYRLRRAEAGGPDYAISIGMLWEVIRYERGDLIIRQGYSPVVLNNNHRACYARYIMETVPDLAGAFATRKRPAADEVTP